MRKPVLFESTSINTITLSNRFIRSATWEGLADNDGSATEKLTDMLKRVAGGGVALAITGLAYVSREGQACPWQLGIDSDSRISGLSAMTEAIHDAGGKIAAQFGHAGSSAAFPLSGLEPIGPSVPETTTRFAGREMTHDDIERVIRDFADAAVRTRAAGFDALQIHAGHGYLISQFLSPLYNQRRDEYGGSIENRARFLREIMRAIRKAVGPDYPVLIKLNSADFCPGGFIEEDMLLTAAMLGQDGADAIELSGGTPLSGRYGPIRTGKPAPGEPEAYYEAAAGRYKKKIGVPLMLVGGIRTFETSTRLVAEGIVDYITLSRPLICEPGLVNRWRSGDTRPALCISDSGCFGAGLRRRGVSCVMETPGKSNEAG
ncbi:MAG: NADH oxidase [Syntrophorhabdaceae bacterium PtaU1.Bin034]|nr:MAG: NADH oxidase [Syntrophorhabdaceae bacterium PtaU1.Bin034]